MSTTTVTSSAAKSTPMSKVVKSSPKGPRKPRSKATAPTSDEMVELAALFKTKFEDLMANVKDFEDFELDLNAVKVKVMKKREKTPLTEAETEAKKKRAKAIAWFTKKVNKMDTDTDFPHSLFAEEWKDWTDEEWNDWISDNPAGSVGYKAMAEKLYDAYLQQKADKKAMKASKKPSNVPYHIYLREENPKGKTMWAAMSEQDQTEWAAANPAAEGDDRKPDARFVAAYVTATMLAWKDLPLEEKLKYTPCTSSSSDDEESEDE